MTNVITADLLRAHFPRLEDVSAWTDALNAAMSRFEIDTPPRAAAFVAQIAHEVGLSHQVARVRLVENLNYSAARLRVVFPKYFQTDAIATDYAGRPERIANRVYARRLGNKDEASGDGWRFRGRGLLQITGRTNYRAAGAALGLDLETQPELLEQPRYAALAAAHFWYAAQLNAVADDRADDDDVADFRLITKIINGGYHGLADRQARWGRAQEALRA